MTFEKYAISCISDVHLLHPRTPTSHIIKNIQQYFLSPQALVNVKLMVIAGDFFDREGSFTDQNVHDCLFIIAKIIRTCSERSICLRVLNGTPSHDRDQSVSFSTVIQMLGVRIDFKYVTNIEVEHIKSLGIDVLYVPDEMNYDTADTLAEVRRVLKLQNKECVDFAFMHGLFDFQVPEITKPHIKHSSQDYLNLVKKFIFIGHDHTCKINGRIGVQGSFDRLAQNEEEKKGFLRATVSEENTSWEFIENKGALPYITVTCYLDDLEEVLSYIAAKVEHLPSDSHVRVLTKKSSPLLTNPSALRRARLDVHWRVDTKEKKSLEIKNISSHSKLNLEKIIITENSVEKLIRDRLAAKNIKDAVIESVANKLKELQ